MTRAIPTMLKGVLCAGLIGACLAPALAEAQIEVRVYPPSWYIATTTPVYYQGRPAYWWNDRWYYREGRSWRTYREEPGYLRGHRERQERDRHHYGRANQGGMRRR